MMEKNCELSSMKNASAFKVRLSSCLVLQRRKFPNKTLLLTICGHSLVAVCRPFMIAQYNEKKQYKKPLACDDDVGILILSCAEILFKCVSLLLLCVVYKNIMTFFIIVALLLKKRGNQQVLLSVLK